MHGKSKTGVSLLMSPLAVSSPLRCLRAHRSLRLRWSCASQFTTRIGGAVRQTELSSSLKNWNEEEALFTFTRGRFVVEEAKQMQARTVRFDMNELARIAAKSVGAGRCVHVEKCPDGMYSKAYIFRMDDGREVIGKVPNPNAGQPHYTTASEVATLDFARTTLSTPVPRMLAWSSRAQANPVGAEYIIMEMARGVALRRVWEKMKAPDKATLLKQIRCLMEKWFSISFTRIGSLYYAADTDGGPHKEPLFTDLASGDGKAVPDSRFLVGPSVGRDWVDESRWRIECDRGPWDSAAQYRLAVGLREEAALEQVDCLPKTMVMIAGPGLYTPTVESKLSALRSYREILPHIIPHDKALSTNHLWHNDLHHENIFVDPNNPTEITAIIDWQSAYIAPLYDQHPVPSLISSEYNGPPIDDDLTQPKLPADYQSFEPDAKEDAFREYVSKSLMVVWLRALAKNNPAQYLAARFQDSTAGSLLQIARRISEVGEAHFMGLLLDLRDEWERLQSTSKASPPPTFPLNWTPEEVGRIQADAANADMGIKLIKQMEEMLGAMWPDKGLAEHDDYDKTIKFLAGKLQEVVEHYAKNEGEREAWRRLWPFDVPS